MSVVETELDRLSLLAVGGQVSYVTTGPEGETSRGWWRVTSVDPPSSPEFTDGFADDRTGRSRRRP